MGPDIPLVNRIADAANSLNMDVCLVGGTVRDILLGRDIIDLDFVVEGDVQRLAQAAFSSAPVKLHKKFMTMSVFLEDYGWVDFAGARTDRYDFCGAMPKVTPASIEEDLFRRDFSINAMAMGIGTRKYKKGELIDRFAGQSALAKKELSVLHDKSFCDDPIRILRGIRLCMRLGFSFTEKVLGLVSDAKEKRYIFNVPKERIRDEIMLAFKEPVPGRVLEMEYDLLGFEWIYDGLSREQISNLNKIEDFFDSMPVDVADKIIKAYRFPKKFLTRRMRKGRGKN